MINGQGYRVLMRALRLAGAGHVPVYRVPRDANGAATGAVARIGCLYGLRYERGQSANLLVDIPGVVARVDAPRLLCVYQPAVHPDVREGDALRIGERWYTVVASALQMGYVLDVILKEGAAPDGIQI